MTRMSLEQEIEALRRTWARERTAALYDNILDYLDDVPAGMPREVVARLEDSAAGLREQIARMVVTR